MSEIREKPWQIQNIVFAVILVLLFFLVCRLFAPFFTVLLWSILFFIILKPLHQKCTASLDRTRLKGKIAYNAWALIFSFGTVILIFVPFSFVVFQLFRQVIELINIVRDYLASHSFNSSGILEDFSRFIRDFSSGQIVISAESLRSQIMGYVSSGLENLLRFSTNVVRNVGTFLLVLVFMFFCLFFFFLDGPHLFRVVKRIIPIRKEYIEALTGKFKEISRRLVLGYLMVALAEATAAFVIFTLFGVSGSLVFAALIFFSAFIPMVGPSLVWFPLGILRIVNGNPGNGILLMIISAAFISTIENILRPIILGDRLQLHPLIIFFAILGGLTVFGFNGIILGPILVIIFLTVLDLFLTEHKLE